jgi:hypothetical protein
MSNGREPHQVTVTVSEVQPGWIVVQAGDPPPADRDLPIFLSRALVDWIRSRPACRVRTVLPLTHEGTTRVLHVWYDHEEETD